MRTTTIGLLAVLAIASCGGPARTPRPATLAARARPSATAPSPCAREGAAEDPRVCAVAHLDDAAGTIEVTLRIEPAALPERRREVRLAFRAATFGPRYVEEHVDVIGAPAWPATLRRVDAPIVIHYRVSLDYFERGHPAAGRSGISWRRPGGWHLTGRTFLPDVWVDGRRADVPATLVLDAGELPLWTAAGTERGVFDADSLSRLADEAYEAGTLVTAQRDVGSSVLLVAAGEGASLDASADLLARALRSLTARLGPPPAETSMFAFHQLDEAPWAERLGSSVVQVGRGALPADPYAETTGIAIHELVQLWSPGTHTIAEDWLEEGIADYLTVLTLAELLEAPRAATARVVMRSHARYAGGSEQRSLREETNGGRWSYDAGLSLGFCLDAQLRESGSSLGAAMRTMLGRDEAELGAEALLEDLAAVSPSSASYLEALLATEGAFALDECLARYGFEAREVSYDGWNDHALGADVLGIATMRPFTHTQGIDVEAVIEGSTFAAGDALLDIEGVRVAELEDVAWAIRHVRAGQRIRAMVRRDGDNVALELEMPRIAEDQREERVYVEIVAADRRLAAR